MLSAHISPYSSPYSQYTGRQGWRQSLPQVPFPPQHPPLNYTSKQLTVFWCLTVAAMIVVHVRLLRRYPTASLSLDKFTYRRHNATFLPKKNDFKK